MSKEEAKEVALVTAIIIQEDILMGTVFQTFDKAYEIATKFVELYPPDLDWGVDEITDHEGKPVGEFDDTVIKFAWANALQIVHLSAIKQEQ